MKSAVTYCEDCDNAHSASKKREDRHWLCAAFPRPEVKGFVTRSGWVGEPFHYCHKINPWGQCEAFTPRRMAPGEEK